MISTGIRQSFGLFLQPISAAFGSGRETFSFAIALSNLIYGVPLVGFLSDRFGPRRVLMGGGVLYAAGLLLLPRLPGAWGLNVTLGGMVGLALSATTYVVVLGAVSRLVPAEQQGRAFGIITAAGSSGMFVMPPLAQFLIDRFGWAGALGGLALLTLIIVALALVLPGRRAAVQEARHARGADAPTEALGPLLRRALRNRSYLLLTLGFFVCGFHVAFISTHLPAYLADRGIDAAIGATALSLIGAFNVVGSLLFGWLGDLRRRKVLLSSIYVARAVVIALFLWLPLSSLSALVFASAIGFIWLATVPLTSGTVARLYGVRYLSTLYGIVFLSHQVGAFFGVWLGGWLYDALGSYQPVWWLAIGLGVFAALIHVPISEARPAPRPARSAV